MTEHHSGSASNRLDDLLAVLANHERRTILAHLNTMSDPTTTVGELATILATHTDVGREPAKIRLRHTHLPKLAETPILEYDAHSATVRYHGTDALEALLETIHRFESGTDASES